ncbi:hypothetical protein [Sphingobacterium sp. LRF_L2]|uniref:hypothetical protein n=1 Tax=Sphingobacterium sp. LRF_L2 TaxID=3369421 RepID=UPI003F635D10
MKEYKISKGWAIFIYIGAPLLIALFCWILIMPFVPSMKDDMNPNVFWFLIPISLGMIALMIVGLLDTVKGKFVIDSDKIYAISTFSNRQLMFNEIKGYRITDKYIFIESNNEQKKKIKVSTYVGKVNEIEEWLSEHYSDLDIIQANKEKEEILNNEELGWTTEQREEKLIKAQKTAKILNWTGGVIGAWTLFLANPYEYAIIASVTFPVICVIVLKYFNGLIRIDERKDTAYPTIFWAIFATSMGLSLRGLLDYNIFDYSNVWTPSILITLTYIALLTIRNKEFKFNKAKDYLTILGFSVFMFGYGYGAVVTLNCIYDKSEPEIFNATVLNKRISSGKSTTYYLELTPWGLQKEIDEVSVTKDLYNKLDQNDKVNIYFMKGRFDIPWFEVTE